MKSRKKIRPDFTKYLANTAWRQVQVTAGIMEVCSVRHPANRSKPGLHLKLPDVS